MVFCMISAAGTGSHVRIHGKINGTVYEEILKKPVLPSLKTAINQPAEFMPDNTQCYTVKSALLSGEDVAVMGWSAQSPKTILSKMFGSY